MITADFSSQWFDGGLFTSHLLSEGITESTQWQGIVDRESDFAEFRAQLGEIIGEARSANHNEANTESKVVWPIIKLLGWQHWLEQQAVREGRSRAIPDGLLFCDREAYASAQKLPNEPDRYSLGAALLENKRWECPLDRASGDGINTAPSSQMLRYLRNAEDATQGKMRWGILTNGIKWRLYFQGARSVSEEFFEIDLGRVFKLEDDQQKHALRLFWLVFAPNAFRQSDDGTTLHQRLIETGRVWQERVAKNLSDAVFGRVFASLATGIYRFSPSAPLDEIRQATLIALYRLLFLLYAEDRNLLPMSDAGYQNSNMRTMRNETRELVEQDKPLGERKAGYWRNFMDIADLVDAGDKNLHLPPYNGGLFDPEQTPLLRNTTVADNVFVHVLYDISYVEREKERRYVNYRDLGVQQLGSIYERLQEYDLEIAKPQEKQGKYVTEWGSVRVKLNPYARKKSGSYYTPDELVSLIISEALKPLINRKKLAFADKLTGEKTGDALVSSLETVDPANEIAKLKVCDPAMGSGHFLVRLVDMLADAAIAAMAEAEADAASVLGDNSEATYKSPLGVLVESMRKTIRDNAQREGWTIPNDQLDDRHMVRRIVLKRCVYGVDKNPMAVELAKVSLWLHTFTVGAPLSFIDHHLRCGDSLFGSWVSKGIAQAFGKNGGKLLVHDYINNAVAATSDMQDIESLSDAEINEAKRSAEIFEELQRKTNPLNSFLSLAYALRVWQQKPKGKEALAAKKQRDQAVDTFFDGVFGNPVEIAAGKIDPVSKNGAALENLNKALTQARGQVATERFLHWQVAFPGVWSDWENEQREGGFDAVIGNPPWDRIKLQRVEWFADRSEKIALAPRAADRNSLINQEVDTAGALATGYTRAEQQANTYMAVARFSGEYPLLSVGDINIYSLFVERAQALAKPDGMVALLTPSGIAADKSAAEFFQSISTTGRLQALYDFENRRGKWDNEHFFPAVDSRFKFCVLAYRGKELHRLDDERTQSANCGFFLQSPKQIEDPDRCFELTADDFARVNPNTGTAPIFRTRRDAELTRGIYERLPVLVDRRGDEPKNVWPVKYNRMFDMSNDSHLFRTREELEEKEGAWHIGGNRFDSPSGVWLPLYVGRMIWHFDHRASSVTVNPSNVHNAALSDEVTSEQKRDPAFYPTPQYWVLQSEVQARGGREWTLGFRDITNPTNERTAVAAIVPAAAYGNTLPTLIENADAILLLGNLCSVAFDYIVRIKAQSTHLNLYILEQLPIVPPSGFTQFIGDKTAGEIVHECVLELTYTAHDLAAFAIDMGYVNEDGSAKPPFIWDDERRFHLRTKLDALFFILYGITNRDDIAYVYSTFPIVEKHDHGQYGSYRSHDLCLDYLNALLAGKPDATIT